MGPAGELRRAELEFLLPCGYADLLFTLGMDVVLRQSVGAVVGGFVSPGVAHSVASVAEFRSMFFFAHSGPLCMPDVVNRISSLAFPTVLISYPFVSCRFFNPVRFACLAVRCWAA